MVTLRAGLGSYAGRLRGEPGPYTPAGSPSRGLRRRPFPGFKISRALFGGSACLSSDGARGPACGALLGGGGSGYTWRALEAGRPHIRPVPDQDRQIDAARSGEALPEPGARGVLRSTGVVGGMTLASRVLGLVRDMVFARYFGAGVVMDAFLIAFKIPNMLRRYFAEGAFSQAFVPVVGEYRTRRSHAEVRELVDRASGTLGVALFAVTLVGVLGAPVLVMIMAPGFVGDGGRMPLATDMLRLTFPYLLFISITALAGGVLNTYGRFGAPAFTPVLLNVVLIGFAAWLSPRFAEPGMALALGVFVAGLAQLLFQIPFLARLGMLPRPRWGWAHEGVRRIGRLMLPAIFGSSVAQLNVIIDNAIASTLGTGKVSLLYYSDRLMEFPLGVFGVALATVVLPRLSRQHARADRLAFSVTVDWSLRLVVVLGVPAAAGLAVLAAPMIATLFYGSEFTALDVRLAAASLIAFSLGLLGFMAVKVLAPAYFSRQDTRTPVRVGVVALAANVILNLLFVYLLILAGFQATHAGLALATSIAACLNAGLLLRGLRRTGVMELRPGWPALWTRVLAASLAMVAALWYFAPVPGDWLAAHWWTRVWWLAACVAGGFALYTLVLLAAGFRPRQLSMHNP